jgi:hypothetical protein
VDISLDLLAAIDHALAGRWDEAHELVQQHECDALAAWIHAVLHKIEGDDSNARHWYRCAGRLDRVADAPEAELRAIRATVAGGG